MILPQTYAATLFLMVLSMLCWGSWANAYKMAGKWRFELFYFDYAIGLLITAVVVALTAGSMGFDGFSLMDDLMHAGKHQWFFGLLGGVVFNLANMLLMAAIAVAGMAVAFPVGIGLALIIGVVLNYLIKPAGNPALLFGGCVLVLVAIVVDATAYNLLGKLRHEKLARAGQAKSTRRPTSFKGVVLALVGGLLMGSFFPLLEKGKEGETGLGPYSIALLFAIGVFLSTFVFNLFFMNLPVEGEPLELTAIFTSKPKQHLLGLLGGAIWCVGGIASFVAASAPAEIHVGPAISYAMGQGATLISTLWGLLVWKEFADADTKVKSLVVIMLALFAIGLTMIALAPQIAPGT